MMGSGLDTNSGLIEFKLRNVRIMWENSSPIFYFHMIERATVYCLVTDNDKMVLMISHSESKKSIGKDKNIRVVWPYRMLRSHDIMDLLKIIFLMPFKQTWNFFVYENIWNQTVYARSLAHFHGIIINFWIAGNARPEFVITYLAIVSIRMHLFNWIYCIKSCGSMATDSQPNIKWFSLFFTNRNIQSFSSIRKRITVDSITKLPSD